MGEKLHVPLGADFFFLRPLTSPYFHLRNSGLT